jgi:cell division protein FtsL
LASARAAVTAPARGPSTKRRPAAVPSTRPRAKPKPATRAKPRASSRSKATPKRGVRSHGAIAWIVVGGLLLAGVVFVNLLVLQLNLRLDRETQLRSQLKVGNAALQSELSAALASPRIQKLAHTQDGLVQADPSSIDYINLAPHEGGR